MAKDGQRPRKPRSPAADRPRPPSMAEVAAMAGVSAQTVSRVVNATARVDDATRDKVVRAVRMLGYRPNPAARALATGQVRMIGVISFDLTAHGNARTRESIVSAVQSTEYSVNVVAHSGRRTSLSACVIAQCRDGRITHLDEYLDSAKFGARAKASADALGASA